MQLSKYALKQVKGASESALCILMNPCCSIKTSVYNHKCMHATWCLQHSNQFGSHEFTPVQKFLGFMFHDDSSFEDEKES